MEIGNVKGQKIGLGEWEGVEKKNESGKEVERDEWK